MTSPTVLISLLALLLAIMVARRLAGLVFAGGALKAGLIDDTAFSALVIMVTTITVLGLFLKDRRVQSLRRKASP